MSADDLKIIDTMNKYGGSFVHALAQACYYADDDNLRRIREAFPHLWFKYSAMASIPHVAAAILEKHPMSEYQKDE